MQRLLLFALLITLVTTSFSQTKRTRKHSAPAVPAVPSAKQSDEMKKMVDAFAGMWKTTATVEKGPFFPEAGTATGRSDFRSGPAGNSLVEHAHSHGIMGTFAGYGLWWWDAKASAYRGMWCDSLSPDGCDTMGTGTWSGNTLTFTSEMDMGQGKMQIKETYADIAADSFTFTMESGMDGAPMTKMMTIQYQRQQPKTTVIAPPTEPTPPADTTTPRPN